MSKALDDGGLGSREYNLSRKCIQSFPTFQNSNKLSLHVSINFTLSFNGVFFSRKFFKWLDLSSNTTKIYFLRFFFNCTIFVFGTIHQPILLGYLASLYKKNIIKWILLDSSQCKDPKYQIL